MKTLIVGDIHGCFEELQRLTVRADLGPRDLLVATGDLVDRGPRSLEVVRFFAEDRSHRLSVRGNHEEKHLRGGRPDVGDPSGRILKRTVSAAEYREMLEYFAGLPLWLDLPEVLVVHAGLEPGLTLAQQQPKVLTGRGSQGRPGFDGGSPWWFDEPAFEWPKPVAFGHQIFAEVEHGSRGRVFGLDTGAAEGGRLTGLLVPGFRLLSEPTPDYYRLALELWRPVFLSEDLPDLAWKHVLALRPEDWPDQIGEEVRRAHGLLAAATEQLKREAGDLVSATGYGRLLPAEKEGLARRLRQDPRFASPWGACVLRCFPNGDAGAILRRRFRTPRALRDALGQPPIL